MQMLLASLNEAISCNASECLSWIIVLFNILAVFYLAFCAWFKITKAVKLFGYIWSGINVCATIVIIFFHTCIFTLISAVFTGLITMAILSVVFNNGKENKELPIESESANSDGYYVVFNTNDSKFVFRLYDKSKKYYMTSTYKYNTLEEVKRAISLSRKNGIDVMFEDQTAEWIKMANLPKFVMTGDTDGYYNEYVITEKLTVLKSKIYKDIVDCLRCVRKVMGAVLTNEIYYSKECLDESQFVQFIESELSQNGTTINEIALTQNVAESIKPKVKINKQYIADYLENKYGKAVIVNRRANLTKPGRGKTEGLPLADTHYFVVNKKKECFIYVYEINDEVSIIIKISSDFAKTLQKSHKEIIQSPFPKSQDTWYSIKIDDSWTAEEVCKMLDDVKALCDEKLS